MTPETDILIVRISPKNDKEAEEIMQAIGMIKGVETVSWSDVPVMAATKENILAVYLDELSSKNAPPFVEGTWIRSRLTGLGVYQLRDLVSNGLIDPGISYSGRGRRKFTIKTAKEIGQIWYRMQQGMSPKDAALFVHQELKAS